MKGLGMTILFLALLFIFWPSNLKRSSPEPETQFFSKRIAEEPISEALRRDRIPLRQKNLVEEFDPYEEWKIQKIVSHFMVPPGVFSSSSIAESVENLASIYRAYSDRELKISSEQFDSINPLIAFEHDNISFRTLLTAVGGLHGCSVEFREDEVILVADGARPSPTEDPLDQFLQLNYGGVSKILNSQENLWAFLNRFGVKPLEFSESPKNLEIFENLVISLHRARFEPENAPKVVNMELQLVYLPPNDNSNYETYSSDRVDRVIETWGQIEGITFGDVHHLVARPNEEARVEYGGAPATPKGDTQELVELQTEMRAAVLSGLDGISLRGQSVAGDQSAEGIPGQVDAEGVDGHRLIMPVSRNKDHTIVQIISPQRTDLQGRPFWPPDGSSKQ